MSGAGPEDGRKTTKQPLGPHKPSDFALKNNLEDISQRDHAQVLSLQAKQQELGTLQTVLSDMEKSAEEVKLQLKSRVRQILTLEGELEHLQQHAQVLQSRLVSVSDANTQLHFDIEEEEVNARIVLARYNTYRKKMEGHKVAALQAKSQTEVHGELEKKRALLRMLQQRKEALEDPNDKAVQQEKRETEDLQREISVLGKTVAERKEKLHKELDTQFKIKKDIEIQNKRHEAIVKRLHCQLNKAQANHRQISEDIDHMQRQIEELKRRMKPSQDLFLGML